MDKLIPFIHDNLLLVGAFVIVLIAYFWLELRHRGGGSSVLSAQHAAIKMNQKRCQILDLRNQQAFDAQHIVKSKQIEPSALKSADKDLQKHKADPIVLVCANGMQSKSFVNTLKRQDFEHVFALEQGMAGWNKANMPTVKSKAEDKSKKKKGK